MWSKFSLDWHDSFLFGFVAIYLAHTEYYLERGIAREELYLHDIPFGCLVLGSRLENPGLFCLECTCREQEGDGSEVLKRWWDGERLGRVLLQDSWCRTHLSIFCTLASSPNIWYCYFSLVTTDYSQFMLQKSQFTISYVARKCPSGQGLLLPCKLLGVSVRTLAQGPQR